MELDIRLKTPTAAAVETRTAIIRLLEKFPLDHWLFTHTVEVDEHSWPHSHPVLTMNTRLRNEELLLLSTFVHEQLHWFEEGRARDRDLAIEETRCLYPELPSSPPLGAGDETSTRLHLLVCYLEYKAMQRLAGDDRAREVMMVLGSSHYSWIYARVLEDGDKIDRIVKKYNLLPRALK